MLANYRSWLEAQKYDQRTIASQLARVGRVEEHYGDIDQNYNLDGLQSVLSALNYSMDDARHNRPNPSTMPITGDLRSNLASYKNATKLYIRFKSSQTDRVPREEAGSTTLQTSTELEEGFRERIGLERDLQASLRRSIGQLEPGLVITDDGAERSVSAGFIDITARDVYGRTVIIELKAGTAGRGAVGQILSYMGDVADEDGASGVRGILVAADFDLKAQSAARMVPDLQLRRYSVQFQFSDGSR